MKVPMSSIIFATLIWIGLINFYTIKNVFLSDYIIGPLFILMLIHQWTSLFAKSSK